MRFVKEYELSHFKNKSRGYFNKKQIQSKLKGVENEKIDNMDTNISIYGYNDTDKCWM